MADDSPTPIARNVPAAERRALAMRYGCSRGDTVPAWCAYCNKSGAATIFGAHASFIGLEIDHIVPRHLGGGHHAENLTLACRPCNRRKKASVWAVRFP